MFALVRARRLRFASSVVINGRSKGVARASALPLPSACSIFLLRRRRSLWIALAPANRSIAMVFLFPRQASPPKLPAARAQFVPNTHLVFCTAVTGAPRSLPAAPSRVFCWALPHPHSAPHPRPHSNQPRACPAAPSVVVVVSSCVSSSAPCVRVLSVVVSSCCSTSLSTSLSYFRRCAFIRCAFSIPSPFVTPRCQPHLLPSFLRRIRRLEFSVCARLKARGQRARKDASRPMDTQRLDTASAAHCARGL